MGLTSIAGAPLMVPSRLPVREGRAASMSLSAREQRILSEIERGLTAAEPHLGRALATMRLGLGRRAVDGEPARREPARREPARRESARREPARREPARRESASPMGQRWEPASPMGQRWAVWVLAGLLLLGIAALSAGLALGVLGMVIGGTALTQLTLVAGWIARALSGGRRPSG